MKSVATLAKTSVDKVIRLRSHERPNSLAFGLGASTAHCFALPAWCMQDKALSAPPEHRGDTVSSASATDRAL